VRPVLDSDRLTAALTAALAGSPWADRVETLVEGAMAEIDALREAGYDDSADVATYGLNGVIANVAAGIGDSMAVRGAEDHDFTDLTDSIVTELSASCVAIRASLPGATDEIRGALGGDTVPGNDEVAQTMAEDEAEARRLMFESDSNDQSGLNLLLGQLQFARGDATSGFSLAAAGAELDTVLSGLASDQQAYRWSSRRMRRMALRPVSPTAPPPPPGPASDACDIWGWVSFFVGWMSALHKAGTAAMEKMADVLAEVPEALDWVTTAFPRWLANEFADEAAEQTEDLVVGALTGELTEVTEEQCNRIGAFIVVVLWFISLMATIIAFGQAISWLAGATAGFGGGMLALVFVLMLLMILYWCIELMCAVIGILPTLETLFAGCE